MKFEETFRSLEEVVYYDWVKYVFNHNIKRHKNEITWGNRENTFHGEILYSKDILEMIEKGQYSFQFLEDESIVRIYYEFDPRENIVTKSSLGYYSAKTILGEFDEEAYLLSVSTEEDLQTLVSNEEDFRNLTTNTPISWIRIDFDPPNYGGVLHSECHMHLSSFSDARIVVNGLPSPTQFMDFIVSMCYPDIYRKHRMNTYGEYKNLSHQNKINLSCISPTETGIHSHITHLKIPHINSR